MRRHNATRPDDLADLPHFRIAEAAAWLRCSSRTVYRLIERGTLPAAHVAGMRRTLVARAAVEALLEREECGR